MNKPLRVLIIDDSERDARLLLTALRKGGLEPESDRVDNVAAMEQAMAGGTWDLAICDCRMPDFTIEKALAIWQREGKDQPFIVVSGAIGEEEAVSLLKAGAHDFVKKDNVARLVPAIERELRDSADRHARREAEEALRQSEIRRLQLAAIVESSEDAIVGKTLDGIITSWNRGAEIIFNYTESEVLGKPITMLIPPENVDEALQMHERLRRGEYIEHFETVRRRKDGELIHMSLSYSPVRDAHGRVVALSTIGRDITERKEMEQMKDEMISAVSHEMRTPLTAMMGYTQLMLNNEVPSDRQKEYLTIILRESERLHELISNFLDLQRLRSRGPTFTCQPLTLQPLLEETAALVTGVSQRHTITMDCPPDLPQICGDDKQLRQVFNNLFSNAVKYSPKGGEVRLAARREKDSVVITVRDEGIGIPPQALERIFDKFYRVDNTARREFGGTGLGLTLVWEIVMAHGGKVWVESTLGKGSTFFVSLPVA